MDHLQSKEELKDLTYYVVVLKAVGQRSASVSRMFVVLMQWGCCISYIIFFMKFFEYVFYHTDDPSLQHELVYLAFALCIIVPMSFIDNLAYFTKFNIFANVPLVRPMPRSSNR